MRVTTTTDSNNLLMALKQLQERQTKLSMDLSTGSRLNRASNDAADFAKVVELQSRDRSLDAYRSNLDRAELVSQISSGNLEIIQGYVKEALSTANTIHDSVNDPALMLEFGNLLNVFVEQVADALNTKNDNEYIFSGSSKKTEPFSVARDAATNNASFESGKLRQDAGDAPPALVSGNYYRIENSVSVDFTAGGASNNTAGTVFKYNGGTVTWIPGAGDALTPVSGIIDKSSENDLVKGRAYEIVSRDMDSVDPSIFTQSGASSNAVGTQFIYNGTLPVSWGANSSAALAPLVLDYETKITEEDLQAYEFYKVTTGDTTAFLDQSVSGSVLANIFQYNGEALADDTIEATMLAKPITEGQKELLDSSRNGDIFQIVSGAITGGAGGTTSGQVGEIFVFDSTIEFADSDTFTIVPIEKTTTILTSGTLTAGQTYFINQASTDATDNFAQLSIPANAGATGDVFQFDGSTAAVFGTDGALTQLSETNLATSDLDTLDIGKAYIVVTDGGTLTGGGAPPNAGAGTRFIYDGTAMVTSGSVTLTELGTDSSAQALTKDKLYKIADLETTGTELPNVVFGDDLVGGQFYRVEKLGTTTDLTGVEASGTTAPTAVGDIFEASGTNPATFGDAEFKPVTLVPSTVDSLMGGVLVEGKSYQIAAVASAETVTIVPNAQSLVVGESYTISSNGSTANLSAVSTGTVVNPDNGFTFTTNGTITDADRASINFDGAVLTEVGGDGTPVVDAASIKENTTYQVVDNGSPMDFTNSGAPNNNVGTQFIYNGNPPTFQAGSLQVSMSASDFTTVGASANTVGVNFTATTTHPTWGNGGQLLEWRGTTTSESDLTVIGASHNVVGEAFAFNGIDTADLADPSVNVPFTNVNDNGATLFGYKREVLAAEYQGSTSNAAEYFIAENIKMSPNADPTDTKRMAELLNALITLRDAYTGLAALGDSATAVDKFAARDRVEDAAQKLDDSDDDLQLALNNLEMNNMALSFAKERDDMIHKNLQDMVSAKNVADPAETISNLNKAFSAYEAAIAASSRMNGLNILSFL